MRRDNSEGEGSTVEANPEKQPVLEEREDIVTQSTSTGIEVFIESEVEKLASQCRLFNEDGGNSEEEITLFHRNEVLTCSLLGAGAFSEVYQIYGFQLTGLINRQQDQAREEMKENVIGESGRCQYVVKHLRSDLLGRKAKFVHAAADLIMEAGFLAKLGHQNIVKLRGWSGGPESYSNGSHDGFFLILDRLDYTLSYRIAAWQADQRSRELIYSKDLLDYTEKLDIAKQIASAIDYLHDRDIIFRDLKPDNVGFKGKTVQIFDFGLCRELPEVSPDKRKTFHMSGVGTRRYMAPEVFLGQHYNLKADVYSWTIVFHTMLSLQKPFGMYDAPLHKLFVCQQGVRPTVIPEWPREIQKLCRTGWAQNPDQRPSMKAIHQQLEELIRSMDNEESLPGDSLIERSLDVLGKCTNQLCNDLKIDHRHFATTLRMLEMQMVGGSISSTYRQHSTHPHHQHLRSQYL